MRTACFGWSQRGHALSRATLILCMLTGMTMGWTTVNTGSTSRRRSQAIGGGRHDLPQEDKEGIEALQQDRRSFVSGVGALALVVFPKASLAGEVGAKITAAVTQSELGQSVRRSVVKGAQVMDRLDQSAELFSDRFNLGAERSKRPGRPPPKVIPESKPLNTDFAKQILDIQDQVFCSEAKIDANVLQAKIEKVFEKARPAFERSGAFLSKDVGTPPTNAADFNFISYVHFKAYLDLILDRNVSFPAFKQNFDRRLGKELFALTGLKSPQPLNDKQDAQARTKALNDTKAFIDMVCAVLIDTGLISLYDNAVVESEDVDDWAADLADLTWSLAIDGDITLQSQLLLQDQGFRLYPSIAHLMVQYVLQTTLAGQDVAVEDYYMDTDYNSDPTKFEVKEVLLNIRLESV